jgi:SAM-dependent methyltransferase
MTDALIRELDRYAEAARNLQGWELEFAPEPLTPGPPWDYEARAAELASDADALLDLGTGGGEVLSRVLSGTSGRAVATEWWHVNAPVAARRLRGSASVVRASSLELPFRDGAFDLLLSRHEELSPREVARVLTRTGRLLTQQVIHDLWHELRAVFPDMTRFPDHFVEYQRELTDASFSVEEARQFRRLVRFRELGHLVYHLVAAPWTIPNFSVQSHQAGLLQLDEQARREGGIVLTEGFTLTQALGGGSGGDA